MTTAALTFPHPILDLIDGQPTNTSLQLLQRQLYTNARSVSSTLGGGNHGHLGMVMTNAAYTALTGVIFIIPNHPGNAPVHLAGANQVTMNETIRMYQVHVQQHELYQRVATQLKAQLIAAVEGIYIAALSHIDFGFGEVTPIQLLVHLKDTYGTLSPEDLEKNRAALSTPWNPDAPLENLWARITEIQRIATAGNAPIPDVAAITLTLAMFEKSGLLTTTTQQWRVKPINTWTTAMFRVDFNLANTERIRQTTAAAAGYHGANHATPLPPSTAVSSNESANAATAVPPRAPVAHVNIDGGRMYYCWTHGLSTNSNHTSASCNRQAEGHQVTATVFNMQGGNNKIVTARPRRPPGGRN